MENLVLQALPFELCHMYLVCLPSTLTYKKCDVLFVLCLGHFESKGCELWIIFVISDFQRGKK